MTALKDLKPRQGKIEIEAEILEISPPREFNVKGKAGKVANAIVKDSSGKMKLALWNEEIDRVKAGSRIKITNGYVNEFRGELQLMAGRFGHIDVL